MRASWRGEAVWACERAMFANVGAQDGKKSSGLGCVFLRFCFYAHGFFDVFVFFDAFTHLV